MRRSALKAVRPNAPQASGWAAMLGHAAAVPNGRRMAQLVAYCASLRPLYVRAGQGKLNRAQRAGLRARQRRAERKVKRWLAPRLAALLWHALADLNPDRLTELAAVVRAVGAHWADADRATHGLPFHSKALAEANLIRVKHGLAPGSRLPITQNDFLRRLGIAPAEHDAQTYHRREFRRLDIQFTRAKRPRKETRKRVI